MSYRLGVSLVQGLKHLAGDAGYRELRNGFKSLGGSKFVETLFNSNEDLLQTVQVFASSPFKTKDGLTGLLNGLNDGDTAPTLWPTLKSLPNRIDRFLSEGGQQKARENWQEFGSQIRPGANKAKTHFTNALTSIKQRWAPSEQQRQTADATT
jgi:hypothetical protein